MCLQVFLTNGHDEYWTANRRTILEVRHPPPTRLPGPGCMKHLPAGCTAVSMAVTSQTSLADHRLACSPSVCVPLLAAAVAGCQVARARNLVHQVYFSSNVAYWQIYFENNDQGRRAHGPSNDEGRRQEWDGSSRHAMQGCSPGGPLGGGLECRRRRPAAEPLQGLAERCQRPRQGQAPGP